MKKLLLTLLLATACLVTNGQNTFPSSGNVGIGTTSPSTALDVVGDISIRGFIASTTRSNYLSFTGGGSIQGAIYLGSDNKLHINGYANGAQFDQSLATTGITPIGGGSKIDVYYGDLNLAEQAGIPTYLRSTNQDLKLQSGSTYNLILNSTSGNVLIGKTSQTNTAYLLDVNGPVRANAITVNATGADFVFAPSYKLLTLPELNNFIQKNHHLPEIASAKEMQANGVNLGDNQIKLLQKVEELTLYLIGKDKQLNEQNATINKQQSQIDLLNTKLSQADMNSKTQSEQLKSQQEQLDQLKTQLSSLLKQQKN